MKELILIDGNNLAIRLFLSNAVQAKNYDLWRYLMFTNIIGHSSDMTKRIVVAIDGKHGSWRKIAFKPYKAHRKAKRDSSDIDWDFFFGQYSTLIKKFEEHLPVKFIDIDRIEGDDVIGVIALNEKGFDRIKIISADSDYKQLIRNSENHCCDIDIFDPIKSEYMSCPGSVEDWILEQVLTGQAKDNIYNAITPDNWGETEETSGKRKPGLGPVAAKRIIDEVGIDNWLKSNPEYAKNYNRNRLLVDWRHIPGKIKDIILDSYSVPPTQFDKNLVFKLFNSYEWGSLIYDGEDSKKAYDLLEQLV